MSPTAQNSLVTYASPLLTYANQFKSAKNLTTTNDAQSYVLSSFAPSTVIQNGKLVESSTSGLISTDIWSCAIDSFNLGGNCGITAMVSDKKDINALIQATSTFLTENTDIGALVMLSGFSECINIKPRLIADYITSIDFQNNNFVNTKNLDLSRSSLKYYILNQEKIPTLTLPVINTSNVIIGSIEVVKKETQNLILPNDFTYFGMYRDFSNFNSTTLSGSISMIDLNYDNHVFYTINYSNGEYIDSQYNEIPSLILTRYQSVLDFNSNSMTNNQLGGASLCDENKNGNISYSECYKCFNVACATLARCYTLCYGFGDVVGWVSPGTGFPVCQASIGTACIYIAAKY